MSDAPTQGIERLGFWGNARAMLALMLLSWAISLDEEQVKDVILRGLRKAGEL